MVKKTVLPVVATVAGASIRSPVNSFVHRAVILTVIGCFVAFSGIPSSRINHFSYHRSLKEKENVYLSVPNAESALAASRVYATHPHLAGSKADFEDAKNILTLFQREFNITSPLKAPIFPAGSPESRNATLLLTSKDGPTKPTAWIDVYYPVLNTPLQRNLSILDVELGGQILWSADLEEDGDPLDREAHRYKDAVPAWHGFSKDGDVTGQLVYVNYGTKEDYDHLDAIGADLTGKIVLARYGRIARGLKIMGAELRSAVGVLMYSDPRDDGIVTVENGHEPYPHGPARNPSSVERGSVEYISLYPGDPTTPGYPSYRDTKRQAPSNIPTIPSLPISWNNAQRLLNEIGDLGGSRQLSGKASHNTVRLINHVDSKVTPTWNTMAAIPGHIKEEVILIGNHRDAWVMGAADPTSGTVSLHEVVKGFGALLRAGWRPLRTIVIASWDAEEYGLIGSTEWGEDFASWIPGHIVAYLNVDGSVSGSRLDLLGSPSLAHLIRQSAMDLPHPTKQGRTLWDAIEDEGPFVEGSHADEVFIEATRQESETGVLPLGSGSDYTVFLQRLGVASSNEAFDATSTDAVYHYHSIYDSESWLEIYGDPGFHRHVAIAKHLGLVGLRIIDSIVLPLNTTQYALELDQYLDKVERLSQGMLFNMDFGSLRKSIKLLQGASFALDDEKDQAETLLKRLLRRQWRHRHPQHFHRITNWITSLFSVPNDQRNARATLDDFNHMLGKIYSGGSLEKADVKIATDWERLIQAAKRVRYVNKKLIAFERGFISEDGIKDREWYKHLGVAPGKWLGYGATTFPALTEALTLEKNVTLAQYEADRLTQLLDRLCRTIQP